MRIVVFCLLLASITASAVDSVVVFNEVHYHPVTNESASEWIELHNQMAIDIDLSAWSVRGEVEYTFPEGTIFTVRFYQLRDGRSFGALAGQIIQCGMAMPKGGCTKETGKVLATGNSQ